MSAPRLRPGFQIIAGIAVEHRDPTLDEYVISGLQLEKLKLIERLLLDIKDYTDRTWSRHTPLVEGEP